MSQSSLSKINDVVDYVIFKLEEGGVSLSLLKLQKLLYYIQAWHLAFGRGRLFKGNFQAWIHGPVNRDVYDRFKDSHSLYDNVGRNDILNPAALEDLGEHTRLHIDEVLEAYAPLSGTQLEAITHSEEPWINARNGYSPTQRCEALIDEQLMRDFYANLLARQEEKS